MEHNAEKEKSRQAQITKDKDRLPVGTCTQPPREAVANAAATAVAAAAVRKEFSVVHSDSEDMAFASDSDISDDSNSNYCFTDMVNSMGEHYSDTELQETEVDEEIIENLKKAKKILRKRRDHPVPLLQRNRSTDRASQQCIIAVQEPAEGGGGGGE